MSQNGTDYQDYSQAILQSKLERAIPKAWRAERGYLTHNTNINIGMNFFYYYLFSFSCMALHFRLKIIGKIAVFNVMKTKLLAIALKCSR